MLLLHISDIHFRKEELNSHMDANAHIRNEVLRDAQAVCKQLNRYPAAILISGDIAFAAHPEEYEFAQQWIEKLAAHCNVNHNRIITVPGNHDIDRAMANDEFIQDLHLQIKSKNEEDLTKEISKNINNINSGEILYKPLTSYNNFAIKYMCNMNAPERTMISRSMEFEDKSELKIYGINSAFISSAKDKKGELVVVPSFFEIPRAAGVVNLVLCHHPYSWLKNGESLEDQLDTVAQIQLFGHEHKSRVHRAKDFLRISSSALHPDRGHGNWEPGYTFLDLNIHNSESGRFLNMEVRMRTWQRSPAQFVAKMDGNFDYFNHQIELEAWDAEYASLASNANNDQSSPSSLHELKEVEEESMDTLRNIYFRYFKLHFSERLKIALNLNLLEESDQDLPDLEKFKRVLARAKEKNLIEQIEEEIYNSENKKR